MMELMTRSLSPSRSFPRLALGLTLSLFMLGAPELHAQTIAVMVNGEPITNLDIDQRIRLTVLSTQKTPSRQAVMQELIDEKLKIREAKRFSIDPSASEIDGSFAAMGARMGTSAEGLTAQLASRGIRPETLKNRIRADTVWSTLVRGRYQQSLMVGEQSVQSAIQLNDVNKPGSEGESFEYHLRPLVLIVTRGAGGGTVEARRREAESLRSRIQSCDEAVRIFRSMRNAAVRPLVTRTSADIPPSLRGVLDKTPVGRLTPPEVTRNGVEMVALCERKVTSADTPEKREIRDKLFAQKFENLSKSYIERLRRQAMIEYRQR